MKEFIAINGPTAPTPTQYADLNKIARIAMYLLSDGEETNWAALEILCNAYNSNNKLIVLSRERNQLARREARSATHNGS